MHIVICEWCGYAVDSTEALEINVEPFDENSELGEYSTIVCADCAEQAFRGKSSIEFWEE